MGARRCSGARTPGPNGQAAHSSSTPGPNGQAAHSSSSRDTQQQAAPQRRRLHRQLGLMPLLPLLVLLAAAAREDGAHASEVTLFDLNYAGDSTYLWNWRLESFTNFPERYWDTSLNNPCGTVGFLPYQGCTCAASVNAQPYVTMVDLSHRSLPPGTPKLQVKDTGLGWSIAGLLYLQTLNLDDNNITGPVPPQLGLAPSLQQLVLSNNNMSGTLSPQLCNLKLTCLSLASNDFSGPIPECWQHFPCVDFELSGLKYTPGLNCSNSTTVPSCTPAASIETPPPPPSGALSLGAIIGIAVGGVALVALLAFGFVAFSRLMARRRKEEERRKLSEDIETQISTRHFGTLRRFSAGELSQAANDFDEDNLLGEGGFSKVYKGTLEDGKVVAIKKIKEDRKAGELEFLNEVELISRAVHRNLMHSEGFCVEAGMCMLVLPFYAHGSVASRTNGKQGDPLDWPTRHRIARGAAEGIAYLHTDCSPKLIHRDIKADNVLLDESDEAIIADFGLAKEMDVKETHRTTAVKGTIGHIAPEYFVSGQCSEKTDVYAFGVFMLELISGRDVFGLTAEQEETEMLLRDWVGSVVKERKLSELVDPELLESPETDLDDVLKVVQVALLCMQANPNDRPTMDQVAKMLVGKGLAERWQKWQDEAGQITKEDVMQVINTPALWENTTTGISLGDFDTPAPR